MSGIVKGLIAILIVGAVVGAYFLIRNLTQLPEDSLQKALSGLESENPAENIPELNPAAQVNPFKTTYQNPFK